MYCTAGLFQELNPGPLTPEARIMPLDQTANDYLSQNAFIESNEMELLGESFGFVVAQVPEACVGFLFSHLGFPKGDTRR